MAARRNVNFQAQILVEAEFNEDKDVCEKYNVSDRSLQRWRKQLADGDSELAGAVAIKKAAFDSQWAEKCAPALNAALEFMTIALKDATHMERKNPNFIAAAAGAFKIVAEVQMTSKVIDARIARANRPDGAETGAHVSRTLPASQ